MFFQAHVCECARKRHRQRHQEKHKKQFPFFFSSNKEIASTYFILMRKQLLEYALSHDDDRDSHLPRHKAILTNSPTANCCLAVLVLWESQMKVKMSLLVSNINFSLS